jgi:hypothetical protein
MARLEKRDRVLRFMALVVVLGLLAVGVVRWSELNRQLQEAAAHVDYIRIETEAQATEILRYAPAPRSQRGGNTMESALAEMAAPDLRARVEGIHAARAILKSQLPTAQVRLQRQYQDLYPHFLDRHRDSEEIVRKRVNQYRKVGAAYTKAAGAFPGTLIRGLFGMPEKLPDLKP